MSEIDNKSEAKLNRPVKAGGDSDATSPVSGVNRRKLVRAGLAVAPVAMALTSTSVLAVDVCIKASAFSSLRAANYKLSGGRMPTSTYNCLSHGYWKTHDHPAPFAVKTKSFFLSPAPTGMGNVSAGFTRNPDGFYTGKTLDAVLNAGGNRSDLQFARDILATFLTAVSSNDVNVLLTRAECLTIWNNSGVWTPAGTTTAFSKEQTIAYLKYIYGGFQTPP